MDNQYQDMTTPVTGPAGMELSLDNTRLSLAYSDIVDFPTDITAKFGDSIRELDLSHNKITDLRFLFDLPHLQSLVLDHNHVTSQVKMPLCRALHTLWVNHNRITNLGFFLQTISNNCPNLRILSMMNNEAAPSFFNGGTYQQYVDYRYYVITTLPHLEALDYTPITEAEAREARRIYPSRMLNAPSEDRTRKARKRKEKSSDTKDGQVPVAPPEPN